MRVCMFVGHMFVKSFNFSKELGKMPLKSHSAGTLLSFNF